MDWSWLSAAQVGLLYIQPGAPWENGYAESFHSKLREKLLACQVLTRKLGESAPAAAWT